MKSVIKQQNNEQMSTYPCLKIYEVDGYEEFHKIVLFTSANYGTCVAVIGSQSKLGDTCSWVESEFKPFNGIVELSN